jgi:hypothetical protein
MVRAHGDGADCFSGVRRVLGVSLDELNRAWLERQQPQPAASRFWQKNGIWLLVLLGGFLFMALFLLNPPGVKHDKRHTTDSPL